MGFHNHDLELFLFYIFDISILYFYLIDLFLLCKINTYDFTFFKSFSTEFKHFIPFLIY